MVVAAEAAGDLRPNPDAVPAWARLDRPTLTFVHMATAMLPHWHEGLAACPDLARTLFDALDCGAFTVFQVQQTLEHMTMARADMAAHLLAWVRNAVAQPDADPSAILASLQARLQQMK